MMTLADLVLTIHIIAGAVGLVVAPAAMLSRKGATWHRRWGLAFVMAMTTVAGTAATLVVLRPSTLLAVLAILTGHLTLQGYAAVQLRPGRAPRPVLSTVHRLSPWLLAAGSVYLLMSASSAAEEMRTVYLAFGVLGVALVAREWRQRRRAPEPRDWWYRHMRGMLTAYIAALSAFSVVNLSLLPPVVRWLWPTVVGTPLIALWIRTWRRRHATAADSTLQSSASR